MLGPLSQSVCSVRLRMSPSLSGAGRDSREVPLAVSAEGLELELLLDRTFGQRRL